MTLNIIGIIKQFLQCIRHFDWINILPLNVTHDRFPSKCMCIIFRVLDVNLNSIVPKPLPCLKASMTGDELKFSITNRHDRWNLNNPYSLN